MSILTKVEVKSWQGRLFLTGVTLALVIGGTTMLYPFLMMVAGAMRSDMDSSDMGVVPRYLTDDRELVRKFLETKYDYSPARMNRLRQGSDYSFRIAAIPETPSPQLVVDAEQFLQQGREQGTQPDHWMILGGTELRRGISCVNQERLVKALRDRFAGDLAAFNAQLGSPLESWWLVNLRAPRWEEDRTERIDSPLLQTYLELMRESPLHELAYVNLTGLFLETTVYPVYGQQGAGEFAAAYGLEDRDYGRFSLPERVPPPGQPVFRKAWLDFALDRQVNLSFVRGDASDTDYQSFLRERFQSIEALRRYWRDSDYGAFDEIRLPADTEWVSGPRREAYREFLRTLPAEALRLVGPEFAWRRFLAARYPDPEDAARAHGAAYRSWADAKIPMAMVEAAYVTGNQAALRRRYAARNFRIVVRQMFVQGRSFYNTMIYVALALLFSLTLQPLVAYALSRFQPPGTWKIIFIFVATMAFPPMVGMIPQFLIIQKLGLLNTFAALVLPVTINGMLIFLLKGFFDSIPKDLYDAAVIDGASEFRIFWTITMAMSTPILAVVALNTFSGAWMAFMYPLIVCPDPKMHVLAVWLQQFQQGAPGTAVFASIIVASIPSLLIFLFAQRTIMRGIAVPSEK